MSKVKKNMVFFTSGGVGYGVIEIIWRGHTHWTMLIAGGICFIIFSKIAEKFKNRSLIFKAALSALGVTAVELIFGIVFNMLLNMEVWDYSNVPFNFLGQICPIYTVLWGVLGFLLVPLAEAINKKLTLKT